MKVILSILIVVSLSAVLNASVSPRIDPSIIQKFQALLQSNPTLAAKVVSFLTANGIDANKLQTGDIDVSKITADLKEKIKQLVISTPELLNFVISNNLVAELGRSLAKIDPSIIQKFLDFLQSNLALKAKVVSFLAANGIDASKIPSGANFDVSKIPSDLKEKIKQLVISTPELLNFVISNNLVAELGRSLAKIDPSIIQKFQALLQSNPTLAAKVVSFLTANGIDANKLQTGDIDVSKITADLKEKIKQLVISTPELLNFVISNNLVAELGSK